MHGVNPKVQAHQAFSGGLYVPILSNLPQGRLASIADLVSCIEEDTQKKDVAARILPKIKILGKLLPSGAEYFEWKFNIPGITIVDLSSVRDTKALTVLVEMLLYNLFSTMAADFRRLSCLLLRF